MNDYPPEWPDIALRVKQRADWCCVRCGHPNDKDSGHVLTVHHLDLDKANVKWWNLVALCQRCHLKVQAKVRMGQLVLWPALHSPWFLPYLAGALQAEEGRNLNSDEDHVRDNVWRILLSHGIVIATTASRRRGPE